MDEDFQDDLILSQQFTVSPEFLREITQDQSPQHHSTNYNKIKELTSPDYKSTFNNNMLALSPDFRKVFVKEIRKEAMEVDSWRSQVEKQFIIYPQLEHPNIINVIDCDKPNLTIITEFVNQSQYLSTKVLTNGQRIENQVKLTKYILDIAQGLRYLHSKNLVHTDIRIETLHCNKHEQDLLRKVKIGDFGNIQRESDILDDFLVKFITKRQPTRVPELQIGLRVHSSFDIFCFGVVAHQLAVGYAPVLVEHQLELRKSDWKPIDKILTQQIKAMLSIDPKNRPTADQIIEALQ